MDGPHGQRFTYVGRPQQKPTFFRKPSVKFAWIAPSGPLVFFDPYRSGGANPQR
jgi:hypothetical protein